MFRKYILIASITVFVFTQMPPSAHPTVEYAKEHKKLCIHCHVDRSYPGKSFYEAENLYKWVFMWVIFGVAMVIFSYGIWTKVMIWRMGRKWGHFRRKSIKVFRFILGDALLQRGILQLSTLRWVGYMTLSMGFLSLFLIMLFVYIYIIVFDVRTFGIPSPGGRVMDFLIDLLGLSIFMGIIIAVLRRQIFKMPHLRTEVSDNVALIFIFLIISSGFLLESIRLSALPYSIQYSYSFVGFTISLLIRDLSLNWTIFHFYLWIFHFLLAFSFIAYIPYSKFIHILTCPVTAVISKR